MHTDSRPPGCPSLRRILLATTIASLLYGGSVGAQESFTISVSPNPATSTDPLVVTLTGLASCPHVLDPVVLDGVVEVGLFLYCTGLAPAVPFTIHMLLDPLPAGIWDVRLLFLDLPGYPPPVAASTSLTVTDPRFSVRLAPSPATEEDSVVAAITGEASCPFLSPPEIEQGRIRLGVFEGGICDPPPPIGPFQIDQDLGQLETGEYLVELFFEDQRVAESDLLVLPAGACVPGETTLCLNRGRFRVEATWTTPGGLTGPARAVEETDDSGLLWFFNPGNIELVVKVLDACDLDGFHSFWVFAAGLTDVGVSLQVTDTETGAMVDYSSAVGRRFETITDTAAFATCP